MSKGYLLQNDDGTPTVVQGGNQLLKKITAFDMNNVIVTVTFQNQIGPDFAPGQWVYDYSQSPTSRGVVLTFDAINKIQKILNNLEEMKNNEN